MRNLENIHNEKLRNGCFDEKIYTSAKRIILRGTNFVLQMRDKSFKNAVIL